VLLFEALKPLAGVKRYSFSVGEAAPTLNAERHPGNVEKDRKKFTLSIPKNTRLSSLNSLK